MRENEKAAQDDDLHRLLHHIILANRFWLMQILGRPFALEEEARVPGSLEAIAARYRETYLEELEGISRVAESELGNQFETSLIQEGRCYVAYSVMKVYELWLCR